MTPKFNKDTLMHSDGTTALETYSIILPSIFSAYIATSLVNLAPGNKAWQIIVEFVTLLIPMVLNMTVMSKYIMIINVVVFVVMLSLFCLLRMFAHENKIVKTSEKWIPFITNVRATINILSVIAILAVDFLIFPRKYSKTSTFGYSLMDLGVGLYIHANSIVSPECFNKKDSITKIMKNCIPLLILGLARLVLTSQINYHVPVAEYGIHWNFFFTLLFTKCIGSFILKLSHVKYTIIYAILVLIVHEVLLQCILQDIVFNYRPRNNFFLANKEGISSILGYVGLYLFSVHFGYILNNNVFGSHKVGKILLILFGYSILTGILAFILNTNFGTSRRLANTSYCLWIIFVETTATTLFYLGELLQTYTFGKTSSYVKAPYIYEAINYNGLIFFLLGNLLTGIVNVFWDTIAVNDETALIILILYIFTIVTTMCILYEKRIKLKL